MIKFEWNQTKALKNMQKHGVSFEEAASIFYDENAIQFFDDKHAATEDRFLMLGVSSFARTLIVCHCERDAGETIRIISARKATKSECKFYKGELL